MYTIIAILALVVALAVMAPREYEVKRSIVIDKARPEVYEYLRFLRNMEHWSSWSRKDPNMEHQYRGTDGEVGAISVWKGNREVGVGEQEITGLVSNERIESRLRFFKPWKSESDAFIHLEEVSPGTTRVEWGFKGRSQLPFSIFMLFINMDRMIGKDFEEGLDALKEELES